MLSTETKSLLASLLFKISKSLLKVILFNIKSNKIECLLEILSET